MISIINIVFKQLNKSSILSTNFLAYWIKRLKYK